VTSAVGDPGVAERGRIAAPAGAGLAGLGFGLSSFAHGFYELRVWGPLALAALAVLLALVIGGRRLTRPQALALAALAALGALSAASALWGDSADRALVEAARWLFYAALFGVAALTLQEGRTESAFLAAFAAGVCLVGGYILAGLLDGDVAGLFLGRRLNDPLGYVNGQAAALVLGIWPLLAFAERARAAGPAGLAAGLAAMLAGLAVLTQTRALVPAFVLPAALLLAFVPGRRRRALLLIVVLGAVALESGALIDVYSVGPGGSPQPGALREAGKAAAFAGLIAAVTWGAGCALVTAVAGRRPRAGRALGLLGAVVPLALVCAVVAAAAVSASSLTSQARKQYDAFVTLRTQSPDRTRFLTGGGTRYDYWRIAVGEFRGHPLAGVGAGSYATGYFLARRTTEDVRQPHSVELQVLSELGLAGALCLLVFLGAAATGLWRRTRDAAGGAAALGAAGVFLSWLVHTSVDWLHLLPGLTGAALCAAAVLMRPSAESTGEARPRRHRRAAIALAGVSVAIAAAAILIGRLTVAEYLRHDGWQMLGSDPRGSIAAARQALRADPASVDAYYLEAAGYSRLDDYLRARASLLEAVRKEPRNFVTHALLGDLATRRGDRAGARRAYRQAALLNPLAGVKP
jgi:hypothetical protein